MESKKAEDIIGLVDVAMDDPENGLPLKDLCQALSSEHDVLLPRWCNILIATTNILLLENWSRGVVGAYKEGNRVRLKRIRRVFEYLVEHDNCEGEPSNFHELMRGLIAPIRLTNYINVVAFVCTDAIPAKSSDIIDRAVRHMFNRTMHQKKDFLFIVVESPEEDVDTRWKEIDDKVYVRKSSVEELEFKNVITSDPDALDGQANWQDQSYDEIMNSVNGNCCNHLFIGTNEYLALSAESLRCPDNGNKDYIDDLCESIKKLAVGNVAINVIGGGDYVVFK